MKIQSDQSREYDLRDGSVEQNRPLKTSESVKEGRANIIKNSDVVDEYNDDYRDKGNQGSSFVGV